MHGERCRAVAGPRRKTRVRTDYEVIVVGCGGLGSAAAYWLARRAGKDVLALEQFSLGHERGSSQDHSRIIRRSYHNPDYIALAVPAYDLWHEVEEESGVQLVVKTGGLDLERIGTNGIKDLSHCAEAMTVAGIPHEELSAAEIMYRWPQFHLPDDTRGLFQADSGLVDARKANAVHIALARLHGATIRDNLAVESIQSHPDGVDVTTSEGVFHAAHVVLTGGAWTNNLLSSLDLRWPLTVTQEQVTYFATPHLRDFTPDRFPIWIWRAQEEFYGFPIYGEVATKAGQDVGGHEVTAETRTFIPDEPTKVRLVRFLQQHLPRFLGPELFTRTCLYTMPPDRHFVIDAVPGHPRVTVAADAAHAFKFATLFGRILSELALDARTTYPIAPFTADRPAITDPTFAPIFRNEAVLSR
ncbi:MAG: N-methyl-L-tryptophan oxidase [Chloroflexia bacterium]|nr:N-methyl-L-tryptophan oxidase [Chloroflexia bacterium]